MHHLPCMFPFFSLPFQNASNTVTIHNLSSCFHFFLQFQILNTVRMHALDTLFSFFVCSIKLFQRPSFLYIFLLHCFHFFGSSKSFQLTLQCVLQIHLMFSSISLQLQNVSNTVRMHALETFFLFFSLQFQIVSNSVKTHDLDTLFSSISLQFQIVSNTASSSHGYFVWQGLHCTKKHSFVLKNQEKSIKIRL